jgi:hypothetical protein
MELPVEPVADEPSPRPKTRIWLAVLPAFLLTTGMSAWSILRFAGVMPALGISPRQESRAKACAEVYGVNLYNSEYYVRESIPGSGIASSKAPREFSTVVSGMVENKCPEPLDTVRISLKVRAASGAQGSGEAVVRDIAAGQAKSFERAWIGQIVSYEIASIR